MEYHVLDDKTIHMAEVGVGGEIRETVSEMGNDVQSDQLNSYLYSLVNASNELTFSNLLVRFSFSFFYGIFLFFLRRKWKKKK